LAPMDAAEEPLDHAGPVAAWTRRPPLVVGNVDAAMLPLPERARAAERGGQAIEGGALGQVAVAGDRPREARNEVRLDLGHPEVGARVQELAQHLRPRAGIADEEERWDRALHSRPSLNESRRGSKPPACDRNAEACGRSGRNRRTRSIASVP